MLSATEMDLEKICFSMRTVKVLKRGDLKSLDDLISLTVDEFREIPGCGEKTFKEVKATLRDLGLSFSPISLRKTSPEEIQTLKIALLKNSEQPKEPRL